MHWTIITGCSGHKGEPPPTEWTNLRSYSKDISWDAMHLERQSWSNSYLAFGGVVRTVFILLCIHLTLLILPTPQMRIHSHLTVSIFSISVVVYCCTEKTHTNKQARNLYQTWHRLSGGWQNGYFSNKFLNTHVNMWEKGTSTQITDCLSAIAPGK